MDKNRQDQPPSEKRRLSFWIQSGMLVVIFIIGGLLTYWSARSQDNHMRADLLIKANLASRAIDIDHLKHLTGSPADEDLPEYQRLKHKLVMVRLTDERYRFVYLMGMREGNVFFFLDSEPSYSKDYSPPGQIYEDATEIDRAVFTTGVEAVAGPLSDRWGTWVSAMVPIKDPATGKVLAGFGIDIDARDWIREVIYHILLPVVSTIFLAACCIFLFVLYRRAREERQRIASSQATLEASERKYRSVVENIRDIFYRAGADGRLTLLNPSAARILGYDSVDELLGRKVEFFWAQPDRYAEMQAALERQGEVKEWEFEARRKDGTRLTLAATLHLIRTPEGNPAGQEGICHDITEYKRLEVALRSTAERLWIVIETSPLAIVILDAKTHVASWNRAAEKIFGWNKAEVLGRPLPLIGALEKDAFDARIREDLAGNARDAEDLHGFKKDGSPADIRLWTAPMRNDKGIITGSLVIIDDITERKQAERELQESRERFAQVAEQSREMVWEVDATGLYIYISRACRTLLGYEPEEIVGRLHFYDLHPKEGREEFRRKAFEVFDQRLPFQDLQNPMVAKNGRILEVLTNGVPVVGPDKSLLGYRGSDLDITERKRAEESLRQRDVHLRKLAAWVPGTIYQFTRRPDGSYCLPFATEALKDQFGCLPQEVREDFTPIIKAVWPEDLDKFIASIEDSAKHMTTWTCEYRVQIPGGPIRWMSGISTPEKLADGSITWHGFNTDITDRKLAEERLRLSEERWQFALEGAGDGVWDWDAQTNKVYYSRRWKEMLGYQESEIGDSLAEWDHRVHPDDKASVYAVLEKHLAGEIPVYASEHRVQCKDGSYKWILDRGKVIQRTPDGRPLRVIGTHTDISVRKRAQEALTSEREQLLSIFDSIDQNIYVADPYTYEILYVNKATRAAFQKELVGGICYKDLQGFDAPCEFCTNKIILEQKYKPYQWEYHNPVLNKDYSIIDRIIKWPDGRDVRFEIALDISASKQAEEALRQSERRYEELFSSVREGICFMDERKMITFCNPAAAQIFDEPSIADVIGRYALDYVTPDHGALPLEHTELHKRGIENQFEVEITSRTGRRKRLLGSITPRFDEEKNFIGTFVVFMDITEIRRLQDLESRAQRLETAGRIAGQVAHDFNNLLAPLIAYPDFIREELPYKHPVLQYIDAMENAAHQITEINQQLLTLGRRGHYNVVIMNLNEVVQSAVDQTLATQNAAKINTILDPDLLKIKGGLAQIHRVIVNLIANAYDATPISGQITVKTENCRNDEVSGKYGRVPPGEYAKMTVSDTGAGIAEEIMPRIFEPFFTTKTAGRKRGSGLGLSIVDAVMKDHGGHVDLESTVGKGTSVYLYFPITRETEDTAPVTDLEGGHEKILVVDDDAVQRDIMVRLLNKLGYQTTAVESGEKALEILPAHPQDLVILDMLMLTGMDGTDTYRRILALHPGQKAIIVSGYAESERVVMAQKMGAGAFIRKPLTIKILAAAVKAELSRVVEAVPAANLKT